MPPATFTDKPWVFHCRENPAYTSVMRNQQEMSKFSYSATARLDSDFPFPSWLGQNLTGGHGPDTLRAVVAFDDRESVPVYVTNSNCEPVRTEYQRQLMEYVQVDSFGACLHNKDGLTKRYQNNFHADNVARQRRYKFTLVFMNADCDLWVDTRLLNALDAGSVPIFMGTADVDRWLPGIEDSIIKVSDFESPKALATYIKTVAADEALYNTYLQWKKRGVEYRGTEMEAVSSNMANWYCNICDKIRSDPKAHPGRVKAEQCFLRKKGDWLPTPKGYDPDNRASVRLLPASSSATGSPEYALLSPAGSKDDLNTTRHHDWHLVTYANGGVYEKSRRALEATRPKDVIITHHQWTYTELERTNWFQEHEQVWKEYRRQPRGSNLLWAWKPYVILDMLKSVPTGDWVLYTDASKYFTGGFSENFTSALPHLETLAHNNTKCSCIPAVRLRQSMEWEFNQRCSIKHPGSLCSTIKQVAPSADCEAFRSLPMVQASWSVWRNDAETRAFVSDWLALVTMPSFMLSQPFDDQSAVGILLHLRGLKALWWPKNDLLAWNEETARKKSPQRVYPSGGSVKCAVCQENVDALVDGRMWMEYGNASVVGDWRPQLGKAHLCGGSIPAIVTPVLSSSTIDALASNGPPTILGIYFNTPLPQVVALYEQSDRCRTYTCFYISSWDASYVAQHPDTLLVSCDANVDAVYQRNGQQMHECYARFLDAHRADDVLFLHDDVVPTQPLDYSIAAFRSMGPYVRVPKNADPLKRKPLSIDVHNSSSWKRGSWGLTSNWNYGKALQRAVAAMSTTDRRRFDCQDDQCLVFGHNGDVLWVPSSASEDVARWFHFFHKHGCGYDYAIGITMAITGADSTLSASLPSFKLLWGDDRKDANRLAQQSSTPYAFLHPVKLSEADPETVQNMLRWTKPVSSATGTLFSGAKIRTHMPNQVAKAAPTSVSPTHSSATGTLFAGEKVRTYEEGPTRASRGRRLMSTEPAKCQSERWAVVTTINAETEAVRQAAALPGWCVVVVGDLVGPKTYPERPNVCFLDASAQRAMEHTSAFVALLPWSHFGRKNVGFLYAIQQGAQMIFDFDDDNELFEDPTTMLRPTRVCAPDASFLTYNPYPELQPSTRLPWARGLPLEEYHNPAIHRNCSESITHHLQPAIYQSAANHDPDVDAVYRLTREIPFKFQETGVNIAVPPKVFVPYNAQANLHTRSAMWALLLPTTVEGRVSDIWRGYAAQRLLWDQGLGVVYASPVVVQNRNAHNYLADFQGEQDLYHRSGVLLRFLDTWTCGGGMPSCLQSLWIDLYERGYLELEDVSLVQAWIAELEQLGYAWKV